MYKITPIVVVLLLFSGIVRSEIIGVGIDSKYCEILLSQVENIAGCKTKDKITVVIQDSLTSGLAIPVSYNAKVLGMYEQDRRVVTIVRDYLCPWLLAHEFAHVVYSDNFDFHPESWVNVTTDMVAGKMPRWLKMINAEWEWE